VKKDDDYFGIDVEAVWMTAKDDVPLLKEELNRIST
jgi:uncharacterized protein with HEPN domain